MSLQSVEQILQGSTSLTKDFIDTANGGAKELAEISHMSSVLLQHLHSGPIASEELLDQARNLCINSVGIQAFTAQAVLKSIVAIVDDKQREGAMSLRTPADGIGEYDATTPPRSFDNKKKTGDGRQKHSRTYKTGNIIETPKTAKDLEKRSDSASIKLEESDEETMEQSTNDSRKRKSRSRISYQESDEEVDEKPKRVLRKRKSCTKISDEHSDVETNIPYAKDRSAKWVRDSSKAFLERIGALPDEPISCVYCDVKMPNYHALSVHECESHPTELEAIYGCSLCSTVPENRKWWKTFRPLRKHFMSSCKSTKMIIRTIKEAQEDDTQVFTKHPFSCKKRRSEGTLSKISQLFGLKENQMKCPYCDEWHLTSQLDKHIKSTHSTTECLHIFGCRNCDRWYKRMVHAARSVQRFCRKDCSSLSVRSKEEALLSYSPEDAELESDELSECPFLFPFPRTRKDFVSIRDK